jgi:hypothetical protein
MTMSKQSALEKIESLKPEPKKTRRSPKEQALAPLVKRRELLMRRQQAAIQKVEARFCTELGQLARMIESIEKQPDEPSPESE